MCEKNKYIPWNISLICFQKKNREMFTLILFYFCVNFGKKAHVRYMLSSKSFLFCYNFAKKKHSKVPKNFGWSLCKPKKISLAIELERVQLFFYEHNMPEMKFPEDIYFQKFLIWWKFENTLSLQASYSNRISIGKIRFFTRGFCVF